MNEPMNRNILFSTLAHAGLLAAVCQTLTTPAYTAPAPPHDVVAGNLRVEVLDFDNTSNSVALSWETRIGDIRIVPDLSNNGDYAIQIGATRTNDVPEGVLLTAVRQNGRDLGHPLYPGLQVATAHIDYHKPGTTNDAGQSVENGYWIPVALTRPNSLGTAVSEWDTDVAVAWFPYNGYIGAFVRNESFANGGPLNLLDGSPGLVPGRHFVDLGSGRALVDLREFGIDARTDGVLLAVGAKNEDNYALVRVNETDGTWTLYSKDNGTDGSSTEQDPFAFVFIPRTDPHLVVGRFQGDGTILLHGGDVAPFTITPLAEGTWELRIHNASPRSGVLLICPEGGLPGNSDNIVTYEANSTGDGWIIRSWDLPSPATDSGLPPFTAPPLETPGNGREPVASFVFIPGPTAGIAVEPDQDLYVTEGGTSANLVVHLDAAPLADVHVQILADQPGEVSVDPSTLVFTPENWDVPRTIVITGQDDMASDGPATVAIRIQIAQTADPDYAMLDPRTVTVVNLDDESPATIWPQAGLRTHESGTSATFRVALNRPPRTPVTIPLSTDSPAEVSVNPQSIQFTPEDWQQPRVVHVTGLDDYVQDGDRSYTVILLPAQSTDPAFDGLDLPDVSGLNLDDDRARLVWQNLPQFGIALPEGANELYRVSLGSQPTSSVLVRLQVTNQSPAALVNPATLTFTPESWSDPTAVHITALDDLEANPDRPWTLLVTVESADTNYAALPALVISGTTIDNEPKLAVSTDTVFYGIGMPPLSVAPRAIWEDPHLPTLEGVRITAELLQPGPGDRLLLRSHPTADGGLRVSGHEILWNSTSVGQLSGQDEGRSLVITLNAAASPSVAHTILRSIAFQNTLSEPERRNRTVQLAVIHPDGGRAVVQVPVRVSWVRLADFQEGVDGGYGVYTGQHDAEIFEQMADISFPAGHSGTADEPRMWVDARAAFTTEEAQALIRFDNIIGEQPGQIPPGATIVAAELHLTVVDSGDGSPMFRMLQPWDEQSVTWVTFGYGIVPDAVVARDQYESQIGVAQVAGSTGVGTIWVSVTPDVQAWVSGEANYGWVLTSWDADINPAWSRGTDGMAFLPSEAPNPLLRPRLRVWWVPPEIPRAAFQQGVNGYAGTKDTRIRARATNGDADADNSTLPTAFVDWEVTGGFQNEEQILLRFDDIIGEHEGAIPPGAVIEMAVLRLASTANNGYGDGGRFHAILRPWQDTDTWNTLDGGILADNVEAIATPTAVAGSPSLEPNVPGGYFDFDVTADVQAWATGTRPNHGWAILPWPGGGDGWAIELSESATVRDRPTLAVWYTLPPPSLRLLPLQIQSGEIRLLLTGPPNTTVIVEAADAISGPWAPVGTVMIDTNGAGTFVDTTGNHGSRFYRLRHSPAGGFPSR